MQISNLLARSTHGISFAMSSKQITFSFNHRVFYRSFNSHLSISMSRCTAHNSRGRHLNFIEEQSVATNVRSRNPFVPNCDCLYKPVNGNLRHPVKYLLITKAFIYLFSQLLFYSLLVQMAAVLWSPTCRLYCFPLKKTLKRFIYVGVLNTDIMVNIFCSKGSNPDKKRDGISKADFHGRDIFPTKNT